ncbi:MAG TPA: DoxX family protein [Polyangia bacterium]|nr:DoxX family protein [Polyangia bacterium]
MSTAQLAGWGLSLLGAFPLVLSGSMNLVHHPTVIANLGALGWSKEAVRPLGVGKLLVALLTLIPATSLFGVVLATGWMGGAIASHLRAGDKNITIQAALPIVIWIGFALRHRELMLQLVQS